MTSMNEINERLKHIEDMLLKLIEGQALMARYQILLEKLGEGDEQ